MIPVLQSATAEIGPVLQKATAEIGPVLQKATEEIRPVPQFVTLECETQPISHNVRIKRYPDGSAELLIGSQAFGGGQIVREPSGASDPVFRRRRVETPCEEDAYAELERDAIAQGEDVRSISEDVADAKLRSLARSVRRARNAVKDLARSNSWSYFVTLTLDQEKTDRYDPVEVLKHLRHWLGNNVRRKGLRYVLVPEHHKDGAIHFHGLFNDALEAVDSGTMSVPGRKAPVKVRSEAHRRALEEQGGHTVYNLPGWGWGFSTAIQLYGDMDAAINYVCKYIGKEMGTSTNVRNDVSSETYNPTGKIGGRWYYSGGDLQRPTVEWFDTDVREWEGYQGWFSPVALPGVRFLKLRVSSSGDIIDPWVAPDRQDTKCDSVRNPVQEEEERPAGEERPKFWWPFRRAGKDSDSGASAVLPDETVRALQACGTEEQFDAILTSVLFTGKEGEKLR